MHSDSDGEKGVPDPRRFCAMDCDGHLRNVHDNLADGHVVHEAQNGITLDGLLIPF